MTKKRKHYMLSKDSIKYIDEVQKNNNLNYKSEALELIIREHKKNSDMRTEHMIKLIGEKVAERIKIDLLGIKKATNSSDKNSQIILEMLNGMFFKEQYGKIVTTAENEAQGLIMATEAVEERMINKRVRKLDSEF
ncbi:hypothetical protein [Clostridium faecium]|uniref:Uncharacterized protein n=1 Tax=Clostridium faecium TaxID=2762223 RepID=A0ABR8YPG9_9CLOT|nr:hypothetical protein [Clostridium faecium]MBD8045804.1 hypothetical protein [Clostridium faecium]